MTEKFYLLKTSYHIENIYCSIDINNIENYLKRIENQEKQNINQIEIILIPDTLIYNKNQINWSIFISKNRFLDKINISKKLFTEVILTLSLKNQIKSVSDYFFLRKGVNNCYLNIISKKKLIKKEINKIKEELNIKEIKEKKINIKKIIDFYKIKNIKKAESEIIEKMALSLYK